MSTVPVWVLIVVAIIGVAGPLGAQGIGWLIKRTELQEARQKRLRDDRIEAYAEFAKLTLARRTTDPSVTVGLIEAYPAITLLGGSVEAMSAAKQLYSKTLDLRDLAGRVTWEGTSTADPAYQKANDAVTAVYEKFINVAREDIGHSPDLTFEFARL